MWSLILLPIFSRIKYVRFIFLGLTIFLYLVFGPKGSDMEYYLEIYNKNTVGLISNTFEPFYQYLSYFFSIISNNSLTMDYFLFSLSVLFMSYIYFNLKKSYQYDDAIYIVGILVVYVVTYQVAFNYRTGVSTFLFLSALYSSSNIIKRLLLLASITTHVQSIVASSFIVFKGISHRNKIVLFFIVMAIMIANVNHLYNYIFLQGQRYLESYSGSFRAAAVFYIPIYIFVLVKQNWEDKYKIRDIILLGLIINVVFFFNSHISARLTRPIEPLVFVGLYFSLSTLGIRFSSGLRFLICVVPGISFFLLQQLSGS